jgi:uncharacterized protein DUF992
MTAKIRVGAAAVFLAACAAIAGPGSARANVGVAGVTAGWLNCNIGSGWGFGLGSARAVSCVYAPAGGVPQRYVGEMKKFGVDLGYLSGGSMEWAVVAPTADLAPGSLAGDYLGATGSASVGVGIGANVLFGGFHRSVSLQPLSVEGNQGFDVAGGIGDLTLVYAP